MSDLDDLNKDDDDMPTAPFWMTTFSDMVTLLLTFFVLIVAMSEVEVKKFEEALSYFQGRPSLLSHDTVIPQAKQRPILKSASPEQIRRYEELLAYLKENGLEDKVRVNMTDQGLHVVITDSVMFSSGQATLIEPSRTVLQMVAHVLVQKVSSVVVAGHTDDRPIATSQFPSNWELSGARASSVVRFLLEQETALEPDDYVAIGHGEYQPRESNETAKGRAQNRRVEILFSWEKWQNPLNAELKSFPKVPSI